MCLTVLLFSVLLYHGLLFENCQPQLFSLSKRDPSKAPRIECAEVVIDRKFRERRCCIFIFQTTIAKFGTSKFYLLLNIEFHCSKNIRFLISFLKVFLDI